MSEHDHHKITVADADDYFRHGVVFNGEHFVDARDAVVSVFDHSFLYGDGVFESLACHNGKLFALDEHLNRLWGSCAVLQIELPFEKNRIRELVLETVHRNQMTTGQLRIVVSRGEGYPRADPREATRAHLVIMTQDQPAKTYKSYRERGLEVIIASTRRIPPVCLDPRIKSNNYLNLIMAKLEAVNAGADDVILMDMEGHIAETPGGSVFCVKDGLLKTPPVTHILASITRRVVLDLASRGGLVTQPPLVQTLTPYDLYTANEVFVAGTGCEISWVARVDGRVIGDGARGTITTSVEDAYARALTETTAA